MALCRLSKKGRRATFGVFCRSEGLGVSRARVTLIQVMSGFVEHFFFPVLLYFSCMNPQRNGHLRGVQQMSETVFSMKRY